MLQLSQLLLLPLKKFQSRWLHVNPPIPHLPVLIQSLLSCGWQRKVLGACSGQSKK
jgi:hypothetical protein